MFFLSIVAKEKKSLKLQQGRLGSDCRENGSSGEGGEAGEQTVWRSCRVSVAGGQGKTISLKGPLYRAEIREGVYGD